MYMYENLAILGAAVFALFGFIMGPSVLDLPKTDQKLFMGWFGPRGLASIVFAVIVFNKQLPHAETITMTAVCTIVLSVVGHGLSANPLVALLAALLKRDTPETV